MGFLELCEDCYVIACREDPSMTTTPPPGQQNARTRKKTSRLLIRTAKRTPGR